MIFLSDCAIKTSVILLIALSSIPLLRKRSAAVRHWVLTVAIFFAAVTPVLNLVTPSWNPGPAVSERWFLGLVEAPTSDVALSIVATQDEHAAPEESAVPAYPPEYLAAMIWLIGVSIGLFILFTGLARLARVAGASQPMRDGRWIRLAATIFEGTRAATARPTFAESKLFDIGDLGCAPARTYFACGRQWMAGRTCSDRAPPRAGTHPTSRLDRAAHGAMASNRVLVQPTALDCVPPITSGK